MLERAEDVPELKTWLQKLDKGMYDTIQNEVVELFAHEIQRLIIADMEYSEYFGIVADGSTDISGNGQFALCVQFSPNFRLTNAYLGMYNSPDGTGETLAKVIKDMLLRLHVSLGRLVGFAFDGASNMSGKHRGVQAILKQDCPGALYVHCSNHSLDIVLQEVASTVKGIASALHFVKDVSNLIRESSKRKAIFKYMFMPGEAVISLNSFCPTRWCVRAKAIAKVLDTYRQVLNAVSEIKKDKNKRGDARARASGLHKQGLEHRTYFFILVSSKVFKKCESVATQLQGEAVSAGDTIVLVSILRNEIQKCRSDVEFDELLMEADSHVEDYGLVKTVKRQAATPARLTHTNSRANECIGPDVKLKQGYFQCLDLVHEEFDQEDLAIAASREKLLLTSECADVESHCDELMAQSKLPASIDNAKLHSQLSQLGQLLKLKDCTPKKVSELALILESESDVVRALLSEAVKLVKLVQNRPSSAASAERAFSCLRRVKTYLRSTMTQSRLTHMIVINMNKA